MISEKSGIDRSRFRVLYLFSLSSVLILSGRLIAQTPTQTAAQAPPSTAVVMVQIQCNPGTADAFLEAFEKEEVPILREAVRKGDVFTGFTYFESPLVAQDVDFVLLFELKSFGTFDLRRLPPHWEGLIRRMGPEGYAAYMKQMGTYEKTVKVSIFRSYKVKP
jgi:hypothetical protein